MEYKQLQIGSILTERLGEVWVAFSERGLVVLEYRVRRDQFEASVRKQARGAVEIFSVESSAAISSATCEIAEFVEGKRRAFDMPIDWSALRSDFQRTTLQAVYAIPYGETRTYGEIAVQIGYPQAPRAVSRANATNPMPLVVPCHRVIGSDGKLHGYGGAGGLETKQWLLELEGAQITHRQYV